MGRRNRAPIRLEIVGLSQWIFDNCRQSLQTILGSPDSRGRASASQTISADVQSKLRDVPKDLIEIHSKVALLCVDFERAYGRRTEIKVFERSSNPVFSLFLRRGIRADESRSPEFFINGVRVYKGVPNSFSELDEAIDKAFGHSRPE